MTAHVWTLLCGNNNYDNKYAYASQLNSFTHLRSLLVLHDHGILAHATSGTDWASLLQLKSLRYILELRLGYYDVSRFTFSEGIPPVRCVTISVVELTT
jgi:hypothetical protein